MDKITIIWAIGIILIVVFAMFNPEKPQTTNEEDSTWMYEIEITEDLEWEGASAEPLILKKEELEKLLDFKYIPYRRSQILEERRKEFEETLKELKKLVEGN